MINLLPPDVKENYRYARRNSRLLSWMFACGFALIGMVGISIGGWFYLDQTAQEDARHAETLQVGLKAQNEAETKKQVTEISNNLKLALDVLSKQIMYSQVLKQITSTIPNNVVLSNLNLMQGQGSMDIAANTADYAAATQLQVNLADPANKLFTQADIVAITCTDSAEAAVAERYPCTVSIRALFAKDNQFLFISNNTSKITGATRP